MTGCGWSFYGLVSLSCSVKERGQRDWDNQVGVFFFLVGGEAGAMFCYHRFLSRKSGKKLHFFSLIWLVLSAGRHVSRPASFEANFRGRARKGDDEGVGFSVSFSVTLSSRDCPQLSPPATTAAAATFTARRTRSPSAPLSTFHCGGEPHETHLVSAEPTSIM